MSKKTLDNAKDVMPMNRDAQAMRPYYNEAGQPVVLQYQGTGNRFDANNWKEVPVRNATLR